MFNRREFGKRTGVGLFALATAGSISLTGCSVFTDILNWIPIGIAALNGIVTVLGSLVPPQAAVFIGLAKAAFADLAAAVTQYNNDTNPADKATLLAKIRTFLSDVATNFQSFLNALNLGNNPIVNIVIGLAQVVLSAIMGFMGQLPAATPLPVTAMIGGKNMTVQPKLYKHVSTFKSDYNNVCALYHHPEIELN